eukprot:tig00000042_g15566.t1
MEPLELGDLPGDLVAAVLSHLSRDELVRIARNVSKTWRTLAASSALWTTIRLEEPLPWARLRVIVDEINAAGVDVEEIDLGSLSEELSLGHVEFLGEKLPAIQRLSLPAPGAGVLSAIVRSWTRLVDLHLTMRRTGWPGVEALNEVSRLGPLQLRALAVEAPMDGQQAQRIVRAASTTLRALSLTVSGHLGLGWVAPPPIELFVDLDLAEQLPSLSQLSLRLVRPAAHVPNLERVFSPRGLTRLCLGGFPVHAALLEQLPPGLRHLEVAATESLVRAAVRGHMALESAALSSPSLARADFVGCPRLAALSLVRAPPSGGPGEGEESLDVALSCLPSLSELSVHARRARVAWEGPDPAPLRSLSLPYPPPTPVLAAHGPTLRCLAVRAPPPAAERAAAEGPAGPAALDARTAARLYGGYDALEGGEEEGRPLDLEALLAACPRLEELSVAHAALAPESEDSEAATRVRGARRLRALCLRHVDFARPLGSGLARAGSGGSGGGAFEFLDLPRLEEAEIAYCSFAPVRSRLAGCPSLARVHLRSAGQPAVLLWLLAQLGAGDSLPSLREVSASGLGPINRDLRFLLRSRRLAPPRRGVPLPRPGLLPRPRAALTLLRAPSGGSPPPSPVHLPDQLAVAAGSAAWALFSQFEGEPCGPAPQDAWSDSD